MEDHNVKQLGRISMYVKCMGGGGVNAALQGNRAGSNPRLYLEIL